MERVEGVSDQGKAVLVNRNEDYLFLFYYNTEQRIIRREIPVKDYQEDIDMFTKFLRISWREK